MNRRFRPIPPRAQAVEFSLKKTSRGEVQEQKVIERTLPSGGGQPSTSPRKRQRMEDEEVSATNIPEDDAFLYVELPQAQGHVSVQFMVLFPLIHFLPDKPRLPS